MLRVSTRFDPEQNLWFYQMREKKAVTSGPHKVKDLATTVVLEPDDSLSYHEEYYTHDDKILVWHSNLPNDVEIFASKDECEQKAREAEALAQIEG